MKFIKRILALFCCCVCFVCVSSMVAEKATVKLRLADAVITTAKGERIEVPTSALVRRPAPEGLFTADALIAMVATIVTGGLLTFILIPFNAYLIQFSIEHTPDGRFSLFDAA